jgi:hypothetical protein
MYDKQGEITINKNELYARPSKYKIKHPEYLLFVDETGCNTNMKDDGFAGGQMFVLPVDLGFHGGCNGSITDLHFTVLCFTSAVGIPVLCAVILKSTKGIQDVPLGWKLGIDICKEIVTGETTIETFDQNFGEDKACAGGPKCFSNGKVIPCFVGCSPKASITSKMLTKMLKLLDSLEVYDRSTGKLPVLVLDGNHSGMKLPFLKYINDPEHLWTVCLGVPYGTLIWQLADLAELNGS